MSEDEDGLYVTHVDYATLQREMEELKNERWNVVAMRNGALERAEAAERSLAAYKHDAEALLVINRAATAALETTGRELAEARKLLKELDDCVFTDLDGLHLSEYGYQQIADRLGAALTNAAEAGR
jgi:hypothetical protein